MRTYNGDVFLASSAQDNYIRLWKITRVVEAASSTSLLSRTPYTPNSLVSRTDCSAQADEEEEEERSPLSREDIEQKRGKQFKLGNDGFFVIVLESILYGHDDWVYSVRWHPTIEKEGTTYHLIIR